MRYVGMPADLEAEFRKESWVLESAPGKYYDVTTLESVEIKDNK